VQFQTKRDLARLKRLGDELDRYEEMLSQADTPAKRRTAERLIRAKRNEIRTFRTYPFGIWLFGMSVLVPLVPWALLTRNGHAVLGVIVGLALVALVIAFNVWRRKRSNIPD
jgi:VIT1/CCC1 family predicted Fe2+/Mn2+ transporter